MSEPDDEQLKLLLDTLYHLFNRPEFIPDDPVNIPHLFSRKEDIEISGFLTAAIAWGNRKSILKSAGKLLDITDRQPFEFITTASESELKTFERFTHRTFQSSDAIFFARSLRNIYLKYNGLESVFAVSKSDLTTEKGLIHFRKHFLELPHYPQIARHVADVKSNSAAKRLCMFLRWMVRKDEAGVDFGIWDSVEPRQLICPVDVHVGNTARRLGLLTRKQNDFKAALELTSRLRDFDPDDPVKYDFALFGWGVNEKNT